MRQATLVAFYGSKRKDLANRLTACQNFVADLNIGFVPYPLEQIHATIIGLEKREGSNLDNKNFFVHRHQTKTMRLHALCHFFRTQLPFCVQIGGFRARDYPFKSRNTRPYQRSFSIQGQLAVVMGWPVRGEPLDADRPPSSIAEWLHESRMYPTILEDARRLAQSFNVLHRWHRKLQDVDNDCYMRIGEFSSAIQKNDLQIIQAELAQYLSNNQMIVEIGADDLSIVSYQYGKETLPLDSCEIFSMLDSRFENREAILELYR